MSESKKIARVIVEFYEGNEDNYEIVVSTRKRIPIPEKVVKSKTSREKLPDRVHKNVKTCKKTCRCISFYNLHQRVTSNDIIRLCSDFGVVEDFELSMWDHITRKSMWVWMESSEQAEKVVLEYDGRTLDNRVLKVVKGHFHNNKSVLGKKNLAENDESELDKELQPKREPISQKIVDTEKLEQLDHELDDYMFKRNFDIEKQQKRYDQYVERIVRGGRPEKSGVFKTVWEMTNVD